MCYHTLPGLEEAPEMCWVCGRIEPSLDWDRYEYHILAKHFDEAVDSYSLSWGDKEACRTAMVAKKQRLQNELGM